MNVFEEIYKGNAWGFGSGHGSLPSVTKGYREFLQKFINSNNIKSVVDFGCGDWQFSKLINWGSVNYYGFEIIPDLVERNNKLYGKSNIKFLITPDDYSDLPDADLLIVKDVLQHFPNKEIKYFIKGVLKKYKYSLITNNITKNKYLNIDIELGSFRPVDLREPPFNLKATVVYSFARNRWTFNLKNLQFYEPFCSTVLLYSN